MEIFTKAIGIVDGPYHHLSEKTKYHMGWGNYTNTQSELLKCIRICSFLIDTVL
jgi:hypothetical protein